ncbi:ribonuclease E/G [Vineibacter terrae]|uniref:ribonuclease E/G n=1 Tax=Vineibacter terrae TaxID=2586908 RepID=UPI002E33FAD5|nr:ribonuclease E/G [Vineibacter terrae]HEX2886709.1 ribonuclease E/G [Vineibacter terrae]
MSSIDRLVCHETPGATLLASLSGGRLVEVAVAAKDHADLTGAVILGRIERFVPELDAAFVDIGAARAGFLRRTDMMGFDGERPPAGLPILVQVTRDALEDKGARLTMNLGLVGRYLVFHPHGEGTQLSRRVPDSAARDRLLQAMGDIGADEGGWVVRTAAAGAPRDAVVNEGQGLLVRWDGLRTRALAQRPPVVLVSEPHPLLRAVRDRGGTLAEIVLDDRALALLARRTLDSFDDRGELRLVIGNGDVLDTHDVAGQIEAALQPRMVLRSGVEILFEPGRTLCAIDVDSGSAGMRQGQGPRTALEVNLDAAEEIARQLRLRNIGGIVIVDFIDMRAQGDRARVQAVLAERVADDPVPTQVVGMTRLGLMEITRARRGPSLAQALDAFERANAAGVTGPGDRGNTAEES